MYSFTEYNENEEKLDGDYWKFLDATTETILENCIYLSDISKIINKITNENLKVKMKQKIIDLIIENGVFFNGINNSLDMFSSDELKLFFKNEFDTKITEYISDENNIRRNISDIISFIDSIKKVNDKEWEHIMITNVLNKVKDYSDKSVLVDIIEYTKRDKERYNKLTNDYYSYLPVQYKNFLKMKQDHNYIYNKSLQFMNEDIDIGIDPRISIAPEIEANNDYNIQIELSEQRGFEEYVVSRDATVPNGSEIAPGHPFHNLKEDVAKFCGLCEAMKDIGYYYNDVYQNAGGQINLGLDYLDTKEAILNFYEIYGNCEELLYYICNEEGQLFRQDVYTNSRIKAISEIIGKRIIDEELSRNKVIELFNNDYNGNNKTINGLQYKKNSVCLRGNNEKDYRLEFRIPNGGCNYRTWIDNIRLFGKMMEVSKKIADMMKKDYLSSEEEDLLRLKINLQDNNITNKEKLVMLMNLLFEDNNIKQIYYKRYISTIKKIKETNSSKYINHNYTNEPNFDEVEFIGQYHSMLNPDYNGNGIVVTYDPESDIMTSNIKK
ncbi:MAG: hypothetical protein E7166_05675 [Firmicutes bacterium]|nr:hypothetical protein [Bacillota bacterium]